MASRRWDVEDDSPKPPPITRQRIHEFWQIARFVKPYKIKLFAGLIFLIFSSLTTLAFPFATGKLIDAAYKTTQAYFTIDELAIILVAVLSLQAVFSFFRVVWFAEVGEKTLADIRKALYNHLIYLPLVFFNQHRVGELTSRISADLSQIQDTFTTTLAELLRQIATLLVGITVIFFISTKLTLVMLASFPILVITAVILGKQIRRIGKIAQDKLALSNIIVEETLQGIVNVKAFANELFETGRYGKSLQEFVRAILRGAKYRAAFVSFLIFCIFGGIVLVIWYGAHLVKTGEITVGELTSFVLYTTFVGAAIGGMGDLYAQLQKTIGATERVRSLLAEPTEPYHQVNTTPITRFTGKIDFEDVHFSYPTRSEIPVLQGLSFTVKPGQKVAVVGSSGAGKTTITMLLLRLYQNDTGKISVDDAGITTYSLTEYRSQFALVPQDVMLFGGTIAENIAYGKPGASQTEIETAATQANAHDFITSFPEGYQTLVGERGIKLSGGQRQRIAIARAILKNPTILLLDEATSSLDSESERLVQQALDKLMQNRTTLIIAHRFSTIKNADKIIVIDKGKVMEQGTHEELMSGNGLYYQLASVQQLADTQNS
ncbi:MAG: ATP-binding cassette domain-containing protein [Bacteroidia bacterium]|nr:ATP-binding cassette domain-containing protein [Bacteroidia bacterium]